MHIKLNNVTGDMSQVICHTLQVPQLWKIWGYVALHFAGIFGHFRLLCMYLALPTFA